MALIVRAFLLLGALFAASCGGGGGTSSPTSPSTPTPSAPSPPSSTMRVVPIYLSAWSCLACPQPGITALFQGRILGEGYHVFNLAPGDYELTGTLLPSARPQMDDRDRWDIGFTTLPQLGSVPPISDNGVEASSITSAAGPFSSYNRAECSIFYRLPDKNSRQFRILFRVTTSRAASVSCPARYVG